MSLLNLLPGFKGGVHPPDKKEATAAKEVQPFPLPEELIIPLHQHIGAPAKAVVKKRDDVKKGQLIGEGENFVSANIHAPASGKIKTIERRLLPSGENSDCIVLKTDPENKETSYMSEFDSLDSISVDEIRQRCREAGIVGLGGAGFPTHVKITPPDDKEVDTVILNGCECEPYLTADHRVMVEKGEKVISGLQLIMKATGAQKGIIGIEDNKKEAAQKLEEINTDENISIELVETKYPQGVENMLVYALTGRKVKPTGLPLDAGVVANNVNTAAVLAEAVYEGKPLIERAVTVAGSVVENPANYLIPIGTSFETILEHAGVALETDSLVLDGGPMMGTPQPELNVPLLKTSGGILVLSDSELIKKEEMTCIRCGRCIRQCPQQLVPTRLASLVKNKRYSEAEELNIHGCLDCGVCSYVCPSGIPLLHWLKVGKKKLTQGDKV